MVPLIVLVSVTLLARMAGQLGIEALHDWAAATRDVFRLDVSP